MMFGCLADDVTRPALAADQYLKDTQLHSSAQQHEAAPAPTPALCKLILAGGLALCVWLKAAGASLCPCGSSVMLSFQRLAWPGLPSHDGGWIL